MSEGVKSEEEKAAASRRGPRAHHGSPGGGLGVPADKAANFGQSAMRLLGLLRPHRAAVILVVVATAVAVVLNAVGPYILARATDIIFAGFFGRILAEQGVPPGTPQEQVADGLRAAGEDTLADMIAVMDHLEVGRGVDFGALAQVLLFVMGIYLVASLISWVQARLLVIVVNKTIYDLRRDVEDKLNRLPLPYFDRQPRGEVLSRVTNDIDNVAQSLQQTLSQLLNSLLTVVAMVVMMFVLSPTLALVALITIPVSVVITGVIGSRAQKQFKRQWKHTGEVNAIVEETFTGHELIKVFGRQAESRRSFDKANNDLYEAGFGAQFVSGIIMPTMMFVGNLNYVVIAVLGGLRVASGTMSLGEVQAFIQYSRQFTQPLTQVASMANLMQSGVASAERVFEVLDAPEQEPESASPVTLTNAAKISARLGRNFSRPLRPTGRPHGPPPDPRTTAEVAEAVLFRLDGSTFTAPVSAGAEVANPVASFAARARSACSSRKTSISIAKRRSLASSRKYCSQRTSSRR